MRHEAAHPKARAGLVSDGIRAASAGCAVLAVFAAALPAASAASGAAEPVGRDGLVTPWDVGGVIGRRVPGPVSARWARSLPSAARRDARTVVLQSGGANPVIVVSRSVRMTSPAGARAVAATLRARAPARWQRDDAAASRVPAAGLRGGAAVVWRDGALAGRVAVSGAPQGLARALANAAARAITARLRSLRGRTPWQVATALHGDAGPTTAQALAAFSIAFRVRIPGVPAPRGPLDSPRDGTLALSWAIGSLGRIRPAQRAAVERVIVRLGPAPAGTARAAKVTGDPWTWTPNPAYAGIAAQAADAIAARLQIPLKLKLDVGTIAYDKPLNFDGLAQPRSASGGTTGVPAECTVSVLPSPETQGTELVQLLTHEVFHCFQAQMTGDLAKHFSRKADGLEWMIEGGASWAACTIVPAPFDVGYFGRWLSTPTTPLGERGYDGLGLLELMSHNGIDLWPRWPAIVKGKDTPAAYSAAAGPEEDLMRRTWGPSLMQDPTLGPVWDPGTEQPCRPTTVKRDRTQLDVFKDTSTTVQAEPFAASLYELRTTPDVDVIHAKLPDRAVRIASRNPPLDAFDAHDRFYCVDDQTDCDCPRGSTRAADPPPQRLNTTGETTIAMTGGPAGVMGTLEGMTREDYCGVKLGLIVPGRSIGDVYVGQSRKSVLGKIDGLVPIERGFTTKNANGLLLKGDALIGIVFQIHFGLCSSPALENGGAAACGKQFPQSTPDQVASVQTSSTGYATKDGLGPGSDAAAVVSAVGAGNCEREDGTPADEQPWHSCRVPAAGGGATTWGFTTNKDGANTVLAVAVFNPKAIAD